MAEGDHLSGRDHSVRGSIRTGKRAEIIIKCPILFDDVNDVLNLFDARLRQFIGGAGRVAAFRHGDQGTKADRQYSEGTEDGSARMLFDHSESLLQRFRGRLSFRPSDSIQSL